MRTKKPVHSKPSLIVMAAAPLALISQSALSAVIINEVDYDQPGSDSAEFIELFNTADHSKDLDGFWLELINGNDGNPYRSISLDGFSIDARAFLVVCSDSKLVMNCDFEFSSSSSWLQNGAPDGISLIGADGVLDSMSYEGEIFGVTEGSAPFIEDSNAITMSLGRIPDGTDTDNNFSDFQSACITPGTANIAGSGDCSTAAMNPVPVPAAVWLFSSGLFGLAGIARCRTCG